MYELWHGHNKFCKIQVWKILKQGCLVFAGVGTSFIGVWAMNTITNSTANKNHLCMNDHPEYDSYEGLL